ncbi:hypothetical protein [Paenibacillus bouchesdurhonensis]|uniref:hypothetical protein n=1 Tax=Paenibacillus bouchesdurhonensis TaxID=1870990 RepID=UPI000DA626BC|nr:hypothetical protein [Paenibacillus bouchesdurhonensis]
MIMGSKLHTDFVFISELRDEGYYTYFKDIKKGFEEDHLIPFPHMQEVLIARATRYMSSGSKTPGYYIVGSKIIMQWRDEYGNNNYGIFGIASRSDLSKWIDKFRGHNIPLFHTYQNVSEASTDDFLGGYHELDKSPLTSIDLLSDIETRRHNNIPKWQSTVMKQRQAEQKSSNDQRIFRPMFAIALFALFLIAMLWMPHWDIEEEMFADSSPSGGIGILTILSVIVSRTYWRRNLKWYRPIFDILMILAVFFAGLTAARLWQNIPSIYYEAAIVDGLTSGFFLIIVFAGFKLLHRRDRVE